ncbi:MAG: hypothetical protein LBT15_04485, partial [Synergistaceae bacterium]|nr:hypothetical protein [Synergistaceae bacterium]
MARVSIWGIRSKKSAIVGRLYELGVFHPIEKREDIEKGEGVGIGIEKILPGSAPSRLERLRAQRGRVLGLIEALSWDGWKQVTDAFVENVRYNLSGDLE